MEACKFATLKKGSMKVYDSVAGNVSEVETSGWARWHHERCMDVSQFVLPSIQSSKAA